MSECNYGSIRQEREIKMIENKKYELTFMIAYLMELHFEEKQ